MSNPALVVLAMTILVWFGTWLSARAAGLAEIDLLPAGCRRRVRWWQAKAGHVQLLCAVLAIVAVFAGLGSIVG